MTRNEELYKKAEDLVSEQLNGKNVSSEEHKKMVNRIFSTLKIFNASTFGNYGIINSLKQE